MAFNKFTCLLICAGVAIPAAAQNFDNSGNSKLNGDYFVRQVVTTELDPDTSAIGRAVSIIGIMTFDGIGTYTFNGQIERHRRRRLVGRLFHQRHLLGGIQRHDGVYESHRQH